MHFARAAGTSPDGCIWVRGQPTERLVTGLCDVCREKIMDCVSELQSLLDVDKPFTWVVHDPSGLSTFRCARAHAEIALHTFT